MDVTSSRMYKSLYIMHKRFHYMLCSFLIDFGTYRRCTCKTKIYLQLKIKHIEIVIAIYTRLYSNNVMRSEMIKYLYYCLIGNGYLVINCGFRDNGIMSDMKLCYHKQYHISCWVFPQSKFNDSRTLTLWSLFKSYVSLFVQKPGL